MNFAGLLVRKSADFLFGEQPQFSSGRSDNSTEQVAIDRMVNTNDLHKVDYQLALQSQCTVMLFIRLDTDKGTTVCTLNPLTVLTQLLNL